MAKFTGDQVVLAIGSTESTEAKFAHATATSWNFSNALADATSADTSGYTEDLDGLKTITIPITGIQDWDDVTSRVSTEGFTEIAEDGDLVFFEVQRPATGLSTSDHMGWAGTAYIQDYALEFPQYETSTYSATLKVQGKPTRVAAS